MKYKGLREFSKAVGILQASKEWGNQFTILSITDVMALLDGIRTLDRRVVELEAELKRCTLVRPRTDTLTLTKEQLIALGFQVVGGKEAKSDV